MLVGKVWLEKLAPLGFGGHVERNRKIHNAERKLLPHPPTVLRIERKCRAKKPDTKGCILLYLKSETAETDGEHWKSGQCDLWHRRQGWRPQAGGLHSLPWMVGATQRVHFEKLTIYTRICILLCKYAIHQCKSLCKIMNIKISISVTHNHIPYYE